MTPKSTVHIFQERKEKKGNWQKARLKTTSEQERRREDEDLTSEAEGKFNGQDRPEVKGASNFIQPPRKKKKGFRVRTSESR